jgi:hypothetical protein
LLRYNRTGKYFVFLDSINLKGKPLTRIIKNFAMATPNEMSLIAGLVISALFYIQLKRYEAEAKKEELIDSFLTN